MHHFYLHDEPCLILLYYVLSLKDEATTAAERLQEAESKAKSLRIMTQKDNFNTGQNGLLRKPRSSYLSINHL
ncbi:hypothetical protein Bca4012_024908 [Brassica carinata]